MDKLVESRICTRSMAKLKAAEAAMLAPAKLCVPQRKPDTLAATPTAPETAQEIHAISRTQNASNSSLANGNTLSQTQQAPSSEATSMSQGLAVDEIPMDLDGVTPPEENSKSPQIGFRAVASASIICCDRCNIIFQRVSNQPPHCPLCSAKNVHKRQYQEDLKSFQHALESNAMQINTLQKSFNDIKEIVAQISEHTKVCEHKSAAPARLLLQKTAAAQTEEFTEKMLELENINVADLISCIDSKKAQLDQIQNRFDQLISTFTKNVEIAEASAAPLDLGNKPSYSSCNPRQDHDCDLDAGLNELSSDRRVTIGKERVVLLAGGSNVLRSRSVIKNILNRDHRLTVHGDPRHKISDTVAFCSDWLQTKSCALIILHSGLNDILSMENGTEEDISNTVESVCSAIKRLSFECKQKNAKLVVCSIPEVVDFHRRIDWRQSTFVVNASLKSLSNELGYEFLDIVSTIAPNSYLMTTAGIYYNKHGQVHAMSAVAKYIASWLNPEIAIHEHQYTNVKQFSGIGPNRPQHRQTLGPYLSKWVSQRTREPRRPRTPISSLPFQRRISNNREGYVRKLLRAPASSARASTASRVHVQRPYNEAVYAQPLSQHYLNPWLPGAVPWS